MNNSLQINTRVRRLFHYLQDFEKGNIQIPPFQRDFIWSSQQKLELLDSIKKGYPIGSILFWQPNSKLLNDLFYEELQTIGGYKVPNSNRDFSYILDGYQRLSTLFGCLVNPDKTELSKNEADWKKNFDIIYNLEKDEFLLNRKQSKLEIYEIPLYKFIDGQEFYDFQTQLIEQKIDKETANKYLAKYKNFGAKISNYDIPSIDLIGGTIEEAVNIFSRLNSRGEPISDEWKASALSYDKERIFRLGSEIGKFLEKLAIYNFENQKREVILQCITHSFGKLYFDQLSKNDNKRLEALAQRDDFITVTRSTMLHIEKAIQFLFQTLLVLDNRLLPYNNQLIFMTYFFNKIESPSPKQLEILKKWFWITTYSNYFTIYNLSKQRLAYKAFQAFIMDDTQNPVFYDRNDTFHSAPFPKSITMGSVRAKALALFMLHYQLNDNDIKEKSIVEYKSYKLFPTVESTNLSENTVLIMKNTSLSRQINSLSKDLSYMLASSEDFSAFFITQEMKDIYQKEHSESRVLEMRYELIVKKEKEFIESLGLDYAH